MIGFFAIGTEMLPLEQEIAPEKIQDPIMVLSVNNYPIWRSGERWVSGKNSLQRALAVTKSL
jgi:hypothetical protein